MNQVKKQPTRAACNGNLWPTIDKNRNVFHDLQLSANVDLLTDIDHDRYSLNDTRSYLRLFIIIICISV